MKPVPSYSQHFYATRPTRFTQRMRLSLIWQFFRFIVINLKMLRMVRLH
jgi:hypothetical protein